MINLIEHMWPGPFQIRLPSGDKATLALYHQPEKSGRPIVVVENKTLDELSAEDRADILTVAAEVQRAAPGYFLRAIPVNGGLRIEAKPITIAFTPDEWRGFVPMTSSSWEILKSRPLSEGLADPDSDFTF